MIRVYSHPRSGTNLLMAFLALNFYPGEDLSTEPCRIGHWKNRVFQQRNPWGRLAGHHHFYHDRGKPVLRPAIYVYRDGRSVAVSTWRTKKFQAPDWKDWPFAKFLRTDLDWLGSPGRAILAYRPIPKHWYDHLESWKDAEDVLLVRYEDILARPLMVRDNIAHWSGLKPVRGLKLVTRPVGWYPHGGGTDTWRDVFTQEDLDFFHAHVPGDYWGLYGT